MDAQSLHTFICFTGSVAISVLFYDELLAIGHRIGAWIGEALIALIFWNY